MFLPILTTGKCTEALVSSNIEIPCPLGSNILFVAIHKLSCGFIFKYPAISEPTFIVFKRL